MQLQREVLPLVDYKRIPTNITIREDIKKMFVAQLKKEPNEKSMSRKVEIFMENFLIEKGVLAPKQT